jgi:hypothetical protein
MATPLTETAQNDASVITCDQAFGLVLNGSLNIETCDINFDANDAAFTVQDIETDRDGVIATVAPTYYIKHVVNLNTDITLNPGATNSTTGTEDATNDDSWSHAGLNVNDQPSTAWNDAYLPSGTTDFNDIATITTCDQCDNTPVTHSVSMKITAEDNGSLSANLHIHNQPHTGFIPEDVTTAQAAYWYTQPSTPGVNDADKLAAVLSADDLNSLYSAEKTAAEDEVNDKNYVKTYSLGLDAITPSTTSQLSKLAAMRDKTDKNVFEDGDQVVLATGYALNFQVTIDETAKTIANGDVFGIFVHNSSA